MYLEYDEYMEYGGTCEDETVYERNEFKARRCLDAYTFKRITDHMEEITEAVRRCIASEAV